MEANINLISKFLNQIKQQTTCEKGDLIKFLEICNLFKIEQNNVIVYLLIKSNEVLALKYKDYLNDFLTLPGRNSLELKLQLNGLIYMLKSRRDRFSNNLMIQVNKAISSYSQNKMADQLDILQLIKLIWKKSNLIEDNLIKEECLVNSIKLFSTFIEQKSLLLNQNGLYYDLNVANKCIKGVDFLLKSLETHDKYSESIQLQIEQFYFNFYTYLLKSDLFNNQTNLEAGNDIIFNCIYSRSIVILCRVYFYLIDRSNSVQLEENFLFSKIDILFVNLDDDLIIEFNLNCLQNQLKHGNQSIFEFDLNSHVLFVKLIASVSFDYQVLIDWLISNETKFLAYLVRYLKHLTCEMQTFKLVNLNRILGELNTCKFIKFNQILNKNFEQSMQTNLLYESFQLLSQLNKKIKKLKRNFPYNCEPLIRILDKLLDLNKP